MIVSKAEIRLNSLTLFLSFMISGQKMLIKHFQLQSRCMILWSRLGHCGEIILRASSLVKSEQPFEAIVISISVPLTYLLLPGIFRLECMPSHAFCMPADTRMAVEAGSTLPKYCGCLPTMMKSQPWQRLSRSTAWECLRLPGCHGFLSCLPVLCEVKDGSCSICSTKLDPCTHRLSTFQSARSI